jgi:hypothetical protein
MAAPSRWANESLRTVPWRSYREAFAFPAAIVLVSLLVSSACLLMLRRSAGALAEPLSAGTLVLVGICVATAVVGSRYLSGRVACPEARALSHVLQWGPTLAVAMFAVALAVEGTSMPAMALYLALIVGAEFFAERGAWIWGKARASVSSFKLRPNAKKETQFEQPLVQGSLVDSLATDELAGTTAVSELPELEVESPDWESALANESLEELPEALLDGAWQQVTRAKTPEGEMVTGWVKAEFQPGERTAVLHVAFCPPLDQIPNVQIEQLSGPAARIKAAQVLPQGARFEIRLNTPAVETESLMVAFVAAGPLADS